MGRKTTSGYRFLIKRPDASSFSYVRDIPQLCRDYVSGDVVCSWTGETRPVGGSAVIKLSLGTGDLQAAYKRWSEVHTQIEQIIQRAFDRVIKPVRAKTVIRRITRLTPEQIKALGQRYYNDVLEQDDEALLDVDERRHTAAALVGSEDFFTPLSMLETRRAEILSYLRQIEEAEAIEFSGEYEKFDAATHFGKNGNAWSEDEQPPAG